MRSRIGCTAAVSAKACSSSATPFSVWVSAGWNRSTVRRSRAAFGVVMRSAHVSVTRSYGLRRRAERLDHKAEQPCHRPHREIGDDLVKARLDGGEARLHAVLQQWEIVALPAFVVPALERRA